eukprot:TRINITY_DN30890_c0_g1_i1.p1 TRINITY_DN30890_c0_g1~~TRINITY_DN30890_c0_g1_i1.p1  ORF type:complete len:344 (-),score=35.32 TRINITY_DN30890_c0_g1_i1:236-1267(-)
MAAAAVSLEMTERHDQRHKLRKSRRRSLPNPSLSITENNLGKSLSRRRFSASSSRRLSILPDCGAAPALGALGKHEVWADESFSELENVFASPKSNDSQDFSEQVRAVERIMSRLGFTEDALMRPYFELERAASVPPDGGSQRSRSASLPTHPSSAPAPSALINAVSMAGSLNASMLDPFAAFRAAAATSGTALPVEAPLTSPNGLRSLSRSPSPPRPDATMAIPKIQVTRGVPLLTPVELPVAAAQTSLGPLRISKSVEMSTPARFGHVLKSQSWESRSQSWDSDLAREHHIGHFPPSRHLPSMDSSHTVQSSSRSVSPRRVLPHTLEPMPVKSQPRVRTLT